LGAVDDADINRMSGGYVTTVNLKTAAHVQLRLSYDLSVASAFESEERFEVLASVDGVLKGLNGQDYIQRTNGPFLHAGRVSVPLGRLSAGPHRIAVGGYLSKKTEKAELATLYLDWLSVETLPAENALPTVNITSPVEGAHYPPREGPEFIDVAVVDSDGSIERVELHSSERFISPIRILTEPPYRFPGYNTSGFNRLFVRAFDNRGAVGVDAVTFVVGAVENQSPRGDYTSPVPGQFVKLGSTLRVSGVASDADGTIERVEVYLEDVLQGTDYTAPYSVDVPLAGLPEGAYGLRLVPWDNEGGANGAIETYFQIVANLPPVVTMTSPLPDTIFNKGTTVRVRVAAVDADGTVARVELEVDGGQIRLTDTSAPYEFLVAGLAPGDHFFRVRAIDNEGRPSDEPADAYVQLGVIVAAGNGQVTPPSGGGGFYYNPGEIVTFTANAAPAGYVFDQWIGETDFLANPFAATTTLKVPTGQTSRSPTATYKPATNPTMLRFVLINADSDLPIAGYDPLYNGAVLNLSKLATRNLNIRAVTTPEPTGSVHFALDAGASAAKQNVENVAPYAFALDDSGNYRRWTPSAGKHTLTAWAYTAKNKSGTRSQPLTINFNVVP
ncbi:MAG TPA: Ig-like domain-containing protein, partial [Opitutus sp.]|nr:Ig-like domain-containing protein [Opitutus sp.]